MNIAIDFAEHLRKARDPAQDTGDRVDSIVGASLIAGAQINGLASIVAGTAASDPMHDLARAQMESLLATLRGHLRLSGKETP